MDSGCPKRMVHGPCGGVRADLSCELGDRPCPFATRPPVRWEAGPVPTAAVDVPLVLTDLTVRPYDPGSVRRVVEILAPVSDGLLVGEHHNRPDLPPTLFATEVLAAGGRPWTTLTCRDRNRIVLEQELVGLRAIGVAGVLCVTGDARGQGVRPDVTQVFDLDGTRLAALAASVGLPVAVPEAPDAPPVGLRPERVAQKQRAGAGVCVLNHVGTPERVARFVAAARAAGATLPFVAGVAVYTDAESARVLQRFPGLAIDPAAVAAVLDSPDPYRAGVAAAVAEAEA
ncbi:MAG TPA: methylenetetrahydrofolate reductase, partial [Mycobacteriales bacterium]|nr:methylenetetrahydrofolate reductase [Mycobacteriales bacterium]